MKIVIIAQFPVIIRGISSIITEETDIQIMGEAYSFDEGLELLENKKPDIALIDANMGEKSGLELILDYRTQETLTKFILMGYYEDKGFIREAIKMGVDGYILKEAQPIEILYAIRQLGRGKRYYDADIIDIINHKDALYEESPLTSREQEVLIAISKGLSNKEIGKVLFITEHTVKKHVGRILNKLDLDDRTQAAIYANNKINKGEVLDIQA
ncbi:MAG: response regulator transcription factor [Clostridiales bacterium]|nr:response regulator transcription factor [Clostridiales bacterium]